MICRISPLCRELSGMATRVKAAGIKKAGKSPLGRGQAKSPQKQAKARATQAARKTTGMKGKPSPRTKTAAAVKARATGKKPANAKVRQPSTTKTSTSTAKGTARKVAALSKSSRGATAAARPSRKADAAAPKPSKLQNGLTVERYLRTVPAWQKEIMAALRELVQSIEPGIEVSMKLGQPVFDAHGPLVYMKGLAKFVTFGFYRGSELTDPQGLLSGESGRMRHLKISSVEKLPLEAIERFIREAIFLNREKSL